MIKTLKPTCKAEFAATVFSIVVNPAADDVTETRASFEFEFTTSTDGSSGLSKHGKASKNSVPMVSSVFAKNMYSSIEKCG